MVFVLLLLWCVNHGTSFDHYPSLVAGNATMAVVIDNGFFGDKDEHRNAVTMVHELIAETVKKKMYTDGSVVVRVFHDANVDLRKDYTILLSVATCYLTWRLHEAARKEELTHFAITDSDCPRIPETHGMSIPLIAPGEELPQIFLDLRTTNVLTWNTNINILHDDTFGRKDRDTIGRVARAISDDLPNERSNLISRSMFTLKHEDTERRRKSSVKNVLGDFRVEQLGNCFLVIATVDMVADVMDVARSLDMVHSASQWFYVITDSAIQNLTDMTSFVDLLSEGGNVAFAYNATDFYCRCEVTIQIQCSVKPIRYIKEIIHALVKASAKYTAKYSATNENDEFEMTRRLSKRARRIELLTNMRVYLSQRAFASQQGACERCLSWRFTSSITWGNFFSHGRNAAHLLNIGTWTPYLGVNLTDVIFPHIAHGFRGIDLPITTYHNPPWQMISVSETGEKSYDGLVFDVIKHLAKKLNFTYTVIESDATTSPSPRSFNNSRFAKLGKKLQRMTMSNTRRVPREVIDTIRERKVLLGACAYTVNEYGKSVINFTVPIFVQTYSFLTSRPRQLSRALLFASPFTKETWACLAASIVVMGPILYVVHKYSPYSGRTSGLDSSWQCVWYVYGALLQQGGMYLPRSDSARILIGIWWLVVMVLVATYSGSLVAFLTFPRIDASILTVEDLISRKDKITWGFLNGSFFETYLRNADEPKYHVLLSRAERHNNTEDEELMERVKQGKHALIDWRSSLRFLMRKDLLLTGGCHFSLSSDEFLDEPIAMIVPQASPYLSVIDAELHRMHESGLMNKWISERMPMKDKCWEAPGSNQAVNERKVNVADMQGIFFVLFMGRKNRNIRFQFPFNRARSLVVLQASRCPFFFSFTSCTGTNASYPKNVNLFVPSSRNVNFASRFAHKELDPDPRLGPTYFK